MRSRNSSKCTYMMKIVSTTKTPEKTYLKGMECRSRGDLKCMRATAQRAQETKTSGIVKVHPSKDHNLIELKSIRTRTRGQCDLQVLVSWESNMSEVIKEGIKLMRHVAHLDSQQTVRSGSVVTCVAMSQPPAKADRRHKHRVSDIT